MMMLISPSPFSLCCALLLCLPLALVFTSTTTPPTTGNSGIKRNLLPPPPPPPIRIPTDDESLFKLASRVNSKPFPSSSPSSPRKIAFMFLTTTPLPFSPLWELFFNQTKEIHQNHNNLYNIYIHADPNQTYDSPFTGVFNNRVIPSSKPTKRFTPSLISAVRRLLAHALIHDSSNSMFALISSTCIPLHSFNFTYNTLIRSKKSFIEILPNEPGAYDRWVARGLDIMLPEIPFDRFRIGSQFFVLTRKHARLVVRDRRLWSKFKLPCLQWDVCYPEEHYFPTLMNMLDPQGCVPATLTHVDWHGRSDGHPRTYEASEVNPELIIKLRGDKLRYGGTDEDDEKKINGSDSSRMLHQKHHHDDSFLFARKFSPDSLQPLMDIAEDIIFKDF